MANTVVLPDEFVNLFAALHALPELPLSLRRTFEQKDEGWLVDENFTTELGSSLPTLNPDILDVLYIIAGKPSAGCSECEVLSVMERRAAISEAFRILDEALNFDSQPLTV